jgi:hypothetical protein
MLAGAKDDDGEAPPLLRLLLGMRITKSWANSMAFWILLTLRRRQKFELYDREKISIVQKCHSTSNNMQPFYQNIYNRRI